MSEAIAQGTVLAADVRGELAESCELREDPPRLRARLSEEGYVLLRGVVDRQVVMAARQEVFERLEGVGEILPPAGEGIASGESLRREREEREPVVTSLKIRFSELSDLKALAREAGLHLRTVFGDWAKSPLGDASPAFVCAAFKE